MTDVSGSPPKYIALLQKIYIYFREVFELYKKEFSVGWWLDHVGQLFGVL